MKAITSIRCKSVPAALILLISLLLQGCEDGGSQEPDPVVLDHPIAYVKRPLPVEVVDGIQTVQEVDIRVSQVFQAGGDLYLRDRASPSAEEHNVTGSITGGQGDVRDVSVSFDGSKLLFSLRLPEIEGADPEDQPTWNIWEYEIPSAQLRRIIPSDITSETGQDRFPHYLPDDRIVFSSTRQRQAKARLVDEGKPQYAAMETSVDEEAMVLHVMTGDGGEIQQVSFNKSHDFAPNVLDNGKVAFSRWDNFDGRDAISLYTLNPDGTELRLLYGVHSHDTGTDGSEVQFMRPWEMPDGQILAALMPYTPVNGGGDLVIIDTPNYVEIDQPTWSNQGLLGPAQVSATVHQVTTDGTPSPGGRFSSAFPLYDGSNRLLVSWSPCRLQEGDVILPCTAERLADPNALEAAPLYGIFVYDMDEGTQLPIVVPKEGVVYTDLVAAEGRTLPNIIYDSVTDPNDPLVVEEAGVLHIRSVYDMDGADMATRVDGTATTIPEMADPALTTAAQRPARFLRIFKQVTIPDQDVLDFDTSAYGRTQAFGMREVVGYAPIEPDGSVRIKVPTNVPFTFSVLDANGRRIGQPHRYSMQFRPGETAECIGCHDPANNLPHGRLEAAPPSANPGGSGGQPFPNTQDVLFVDPDDGLMEEAIQGESMAEYKNRLDPACSGACAPNMDLVFSDYWTDEAIRPKDEDFIALYTDLETLNPVSSSGCIDEWDNLCRSIIHYEAHIHPLWDMQRQILDDMDVEIENHRCTLCHNHVDDVVGLAMEPAGQLDLSGAVGDPLIQGHLPAYRELLFPDDQQEVVEGALIDLLVPVLDANGDQVYEVDENGDLILDVDGNPIPVPDVPVRAQGPSMQAGSANGGYFLSLFDTGAIHDGYLSDAEKKLIGEWLDIGAQYYNNPFDAPLDN